MRPHKPTTFILLCLLLNVFDVRAFAAPTIDANKMNLSPLRLQTQSINNKLKMTSSHVRWQSQFDQYYFIRANEPAYNQGVHAEQLSAVGLSALKQNEKWQIDARLLYSSQESRSYFDVSNLNYRLENSSAVWTIGRAEKNWSKSDQFWQTGLWQPQFTWDGFQPKQQGLTGFFVESQNSYQDQWRLFFSGVFVPSMGVWPQEKNGRIISQNPWMRTSPPQAKLWGVTTPVQVDLAQPPIEDVLFQPSVAAAYEKKWNEGQQTQFAYAYKPTNQTQLEYEFYVSSPVATSSVIDVTIHPSFPYEHLLTAEHVYKVNDWQWVAAYTYDEPVLSQYRLEGITQEIVSTSTLSVYARTTSSVSMLNSGQLYLGAIKVWSDSPRDKGLHAPDESQFMNRSLYALAVRVGAEGPIKIFRTKDIYSNIEGTYDIEQRAGMLKMGALYKPNRDLTLGAKINLMGAVAKTSRNGDYENTFMRWFKANDNLGVQLTYVF